MPADTHFRVAVSVTDLTETPGAHARVGRKDSSLLYGEDFTAQKDEGEWILGSSLSGVYAGYVRKADLRPAGVVPDLYVRAIFTHAYPEPHFKAKPVMPLGFFSRVAATGDKVAGFTRTDAGWIFEGHLAPLSPRADDPVETALKFLNVPYIYGGRCAAAGVDCSSLVQLAFHSAGLDAFPRDTVDQIGMGAPVKSQADLRRGDLVFFPGHVGIMIDDRNMLNATARAMGVIIEKLADVEEIYARTEGAGITAMRRIPLPAR